MKQKQTPLPLLAGLTIATVAASLSLAFTPAQSDSQTGTLYSQIQSDIAESLRRIELAGTLGEWSSSGYTAEDVIQNVVALERADAIAALCDALLALEPTQLAHFDEVFDTSSHVNTSAISCLPALRSKLSAHWESLANQVRVNLNASKQSKGADPTFVTIEKPLQTAGGPNLTRGDLADNEICLTFDDGPHPTRTARLLDILRNAGVRTNFFQVGASAHANPSVSLRAAQEGHIMGSHSHSHPQLTAVGTRRAQEEILRGMREVEEASQTTTHFFRFPYGARNAALLDFTAAQDIASFLWNMDSLDWKIRSPGRLLANVKRELTAHKGGIILFHDIHENTILTIPLVLQELSERGYKTVVFVPESH